MTLSQALRFIKEAHAGQFDDGIPYWHHPASVMQRLGDTSDDERYAALLHDVLEDSTFTVDELRSAGFSETVIDTIKLITRSNDESFAEYILRIAFSDNRSAKRVKIADLEDTLDRTTPTTLRRRYERALVTLRQHLNQ